MLPPSLNIPKWQAKPLIITYPKNLISNQSHRLEANSHLLQPPVNNYCVYHPSTSSGYTVMVVGGPNARTDYHINSTPEFFYQYRGSMLLKTVADTSTTPHTFQDIPIHEGSLFLLPANTPHCPVRFKDTVGVVMEQPRKEGAEDTMRWYCQSCGEIVWEKRFICTDLGTQIKAVVEEFGADVQKRTCAKCGVLAETKFAEGQIVQPPRLPE
jgi:3-hydroxyanthranilate 3,4-dioxygenase